TPLRSMSSTPICCCALTAKIWSLPKRSSPRRNVSQLARRPAQQGLGGPGVPSGCQHPPLAIYIYTGVGPGGPRTVDHGQFEPQECGYAALWGVQFETGGG